MKKKKIIEANKIIYNSDNIKISEELNGDLFFEVGNEITTDIGEFVAVLMRIKIDNSIWNLSINYNKNITINPEKSLYWLSGGDKEWETLNNYNISWSECFEIFNDKFGILVIDIIENSKILKDIRNGFEKYLNLPVLYEFSLQNKFIK